MNIDKKKLKEELQKSQAQDKITKDLIKIMDNLIMGSLWYYNGIINDPIWKDKSQEAWLRFLRCWKKIDTNNPNCFSYILQIIKYAGIQQHNLIVLNIRCGAVPEYRKKEATMKTISLTNIYSRK